MPERSKELIQVGYYLSRFGGKKPPVLLKESTWKGSYKLFFNKLNDGRTVSEFEHSLKNSRDAFDGYFPENGREGWKKDDGSPTSLTGFLKEVYDEYKSLNEEEIFNKVSGLISPFKDVQIVSSKRFDKLDLLNKVFNYSWIYDLSINAWNQLLDNTSDVLEGLILDKNDKRLAISLRNDNIKRLSVIYGNKYVGGFYLDNRKAFTRLFASADFDVAQDHRFVEGDWQSKDITSGKLIYCSPSDWKGKLDVQYNSIRSNLNELLASCGNSNYKRTHLPFMYDVILNLDVRSQFLDFMELDPEQRLIEAYRQYLEKTGNEQELYKWQIGKQFQDNWDLDAEDFGAMLNSVKWSNLISQQSGAFFREARNHPEDARIFYKYVFDESKSISDRINWARDKGAEMAKTWRPGWKSAGQDERTLSILWSFNDLKNHIPFKSSFYNKYCALIDVKPEKPGSKYRHYLKLVDLFIKNHLSKDDSLIALHNSFLDKAEHIEDPNNKLMVQNILYRILDGFWDPENGQDEEGDALNNEIVVNEKNNMEKDLNTILYGPPGTGKTYHLKETLFPLYEAEGKKRWEFVTFHQSYAYEDFIEGIKPVMDDQYQGDIRYEIKDGVFKDLCKRASEDMANSYAIFIDEINRGNVSSIFGELITLIEDDKRLGAENEMSVTLPYSRSIFGIPGNVHIIGTMNTADRSVEALDTALRRRFSFEEMLPKSKSLVKTISGIKMSRLLTVLNSRIEVLVDRDHTIGHAFFINDRSLDDLRKTFANKVIPLLQEYFYGDYGKMEMVIGSDFFEVTDTSKINFAVESEDFEPEGKVYHLIDLADKKSMSNDSFIAALTKLMKGA